MLVASTPVWLPLWARTPEPFRLVPDTPVPAATAIPLTPVPLCVSPLNATPTGLSPWSTGGAAFAAGPYAGSVGAARLDGGAVAAGGDDGEPELAVEEAQAFEFEIGVANLEAQHGLGCGLL